MAANEKREVTLDEIIEEIKESKDEVVANIEASGITIWFTPVAVGIAILLFGMGSISERQIILGEVSWAGVFIAVLGVGMIIWARVMFSRARKRFLEKWYKKTRY